MSEEEDVIGNISTTAAAKRKRNARHNGWSKKSKVEINVADSAQMEKFSSFFLRDEETNVISCQVTDCTSTVSRWQLYNFKRHFEQKHPMFLAQLFPKAVSSDVKIRVDKCELIYNAVELVTINGFPFSVLDTSAIKGFLKKQLEELDNNGYKVTLNRHTIVDKIKQISEAIRKRISEELREKLFGIMFDVCTKRTYSVLGISATFMQNDEVIARSLGTVQLKERHRGPYMSNVIDETLQKFDATVKQIISATADQAANMNNTARHLAIRACNQISGEISTDEESNSSESASDDEGMELENQIELQNELNNDNRYIELVTEMANDILRKNNLLSLVPKLHCCAHTTQLAVKTAIRESEETNRILELVREMMKCLRTTVVNVKFRKLAPHCILPRQYIDIRWNSDYLMVISL